MIAKFFVVNLKKIVLTLQILNLKNLLSCKLKKYIILKSVIIALKFYLNLLLCVILLLCINKKGKDKKCSHIWYFIYVESLIYIKITFEEYYINTRIVK